MSIRSIYLIVSPAIFFLVFLLLVLMSLEWWVSGIIFSPDRHGLFGYQQQRLANPQQFGFNIRHHDCLDGKAPCLLIEPNSELKPDNRAKILRQQLSQRGYQLNPYGQVHGMVVLLHGRNARKEDLFPIAERFIAAGYRCLLLDLPAHGESPLQSVAFGADSFERTMPRLAVEDIKRHFNLPDQPVALWGLSMGGAFAVSAASESPDYWQSLTVVSSFDRLDTLIQEFVVYYARSFLQYQGWSDSVSDVQLHEWAGAFSFFVDLSRSLRGQVPMRSMQPQQWAKSITIPTLVVHGDQDTLIADDRGKRLYQAFSSTKKQWITVPGGGHSSVLSTPMQLYAAMSDWMLQHH